MADFKKGVWFFEYSAVRFLRACLNLLPFSFTLRLARPIGILLFWVLRRSRRIALDNLKQAYGSEKSEFEIRKIAQESFVRLAEFGAEWLRMTQIAKDPMRYLGIRGVEEIHSALKEEKGAMLLVSHTGNWEIMALIVGLLIAKPVGASIYALARPLKNFYLYEHSLRLRGLMGLKSIQKIGGVRETFNRLKENGIVSTLVDQRVGEGGVEVNFFHRPALTTSLPAVAALRLDTPLFFVFCHRTSDLRFIMEVEGPVEIEKTGDIKRDIRVNTQRFNDRIEAEIRKDPARWLWMHNRWRTRHGAKD